MESTNVIKIEKEMHLMDFIKEGAKRLKNNPEQFRVVIITARFWYKEQFWKEFTVENYSATDFKLASDDTENIWLIKKSDCIIIN